MKSAGAKALSIVNSAIILALLNAYPKIAIILVLAAMEVAMFCLPKKNKNDLPIFKASAII